MSAASRDPQRSNRTSRRSRAALLTAVAAVAALTLSACGESGGTQGGSGNTNFVTGTDGIATVDKGERSPAPKLDGETLEGDKLDVSDYKGKVVVLNVWGSWCPPCRAEAPGFVKVAKDTEAQGVQFVGINTRDTSKSPALEFEKSYDVPYPSLYDPTGKLMLRFPKGALNPQAIPSTVVIDREGNIAARSLSPLSEENLRKMLKPLIAEK
ncbi:TlpA family protein disulfide reductase [Streptomyces sp. PSKA54]|uniref:TlpA family protein disulfide reductase n=1 Tax=Streptomyces himalayensis subsp. aureolus TaxID=2758039 RepID=A0A7W2HHX5_9ACTN|nr:TlpA disulfide reductase family protein [Streptomyces himalayensis]MBA4864508.1 TlpA family protein disulfide reductase [Streptomyces himalayensis subsp. aureolus]